MKEFAILSLYSLLSQADDRPKSVQKPPSRPPPRPTAPKKEDAVEQYPQDQNPFENFETKQ